jgi:hypothetical protein
MMLEELLALWRIAHVIAADTVGRSDYLLPGKVTRLDLRTPDGLRFPLNYGREGHDDGTTAVLGRIVIHAGSEPVALAPDEIVDDVFGQSIALDGLFDGLDIGRPIIVAGERTDVLDLAGRSILGIRAAELATIAGVAQRPEPGTPRDTPHTTLDLATPLAYRYRRASVTIYGNVALATHGETVTETLGSGDASTPFACFELSRAPLTFVAAATVAGAVSTEAIRVNDILMDRVDSLLDADATMRVYALEVDGEGRGTAQSGDGAHGVRLPTGLDNVTATYRVGIGRPGNVKAGQISLLATKPLGVRGVTNPLLATGGVDRDGPERIRANIPLAAGAFGRLVSLGDYAAFARAFAGIGHADARKFGVAGTQLVHVTISGAECAPLDPEGDLVANLREAIDRYGDPALPVEIGVAERRVIVLQASVAIDPHWLWEAVEPALRRRLLDAFSADRRGLATPAFPSEAIAVMQTTPGVTSAGIEVFAGIPEATLRDPAALTAALASLAEEPFARALPARLGKPLPTAPAGSVVLRAEHAVLVEDAPFTLILNRARGAAHAV